MRKKDVRKEIGGGREGIGGGVRKRVERTSRNGVGVSREVRIQENRRWARRV